MRESTKHIKKQLDSHLVKIEESLCMDVLSIFSPILPRLENSVREAIESKGNQEKKLAIIHDTEGGVVEVVERMVNIIRYHYKEVIFIIPNMAMSAGTVFALSGDKIYMDYFSCLGPIDPQVVKNINGKDTLVPALSYINQYEKFLKKANNNQVTSAEFALFREQFNLPELDTFLQAKELTEDLLKKWLVTYKFKNWCKTETNKTEVTKEMKERRASKIAQELSDYTLWHSHGRMINKKALEDIGLKINDFSEIEGLSELVSGYYGLLTDFMQSENLNSFIHNKEYF